LEHKRDGGATPAYQAMVMIKNFTFGYNDTIPMSTHDVLLKGNTKNHFLGGREWG